MGAPQLVDYARDSYDVHFTLEQAEAVRRGFFDDYPALLAWHDRQLDALLGIRQGPKPHRPHSPSAGHQLEGPRGPRRAERQAINSPVQALRLGLDVARTHHHARPTGPRRGADPWAPFTTPSLPKHATMCCCILPNSSRPTMEDMTIVKRTVGTEVTVPIIADIEVGTHWTEPTHTLVNDQLVALK